MGELHGDVNEMVHQMQRFSWVDYVVFVLMLAISAVVGIYWGFMKKQTTQIDYLLGGRNMKVLPVAMSLVASFVSGITLLGSPTEVYMFGTEYAFTMGGIFLMSIVMTQVYLPVFHDLKITSNYEYLSMRFDNRVRLFGSFLFAFSLIAWLPIVIYVPALAFNQVTGVDIHIITPIVCLVCIFYTSAGGLQAVVWTDVIQITAMVGAMALVAVKGTLDIGGFGVVWQRNMDSGRIELPELATFTNMCLFIVIVYTCERIMGPAMAHATNYNPSFSGLWDPNPVARHTMWNLLFGGLFYWLQANAVNQTMVQRYLALPTLRGAKCAVILFCIGISILYCFCVYCGLLIYARFYDCDPLTTKLAKQKDQLLPLLVMDVLGDIPGLPGVFVAGIFSAALSSLSTSLNSMSAVVLEDFYKPFFKKQLRESQTNWLLKGVVVLMGILAVALVFVVEKMGTVLQLTMTLEAMTMGPQLGVFTMGILMPWVDASGALIGGASGLLTMGSWCLTAQMAIARGAITHEHKPLSTAGCSYNYTVTATAAPTIVDEVNPILRVSYMWYTLAGMLVTMAVGASVSRVNRACGAAYVPPAPKLLAPQLRRLYKDPPHPSEDPYIRAFDNKVANQVNSSSINMKPISECEEVS